jgi:hypothetical protein
MDRWVTKKVLVCKMVVFVLKKIQDVMYVVLMNIALLMQKIRVGTRKKLREF